MYSSKVLVGLEAPYGSLKWNVITTRLSQLQW